MDETVYKIAIAGLLHDIGKFAERAGMPVSAEYINNHADLYQPYFNNRHTHKHAVYTAAFIENFETHLPEQFNAARWGLEDPLVNLAAGHHKPETALQWVIAVADRVSSGFDRDEFEDYNKGINVRDYKKTRLLPILEGVSIDENWDKTTLESFQFRYPLKELSPDHIFPVSGDDTGNMDSDQASREYKTLFDSFINSLQNLLHKNQIALWLEHFDSLFAMFAAHIPAASVGKVVPDVSLYDHCKMTAALASAIYLFHRENGSLHPESIRDDQQKKFLMVSGDFYGIQDFIFSKGSLTGRASAKLLRGRSFGVSLISELAADMLCRSMGLCASSVILNAAGKFTVIAPNTQKNLEAVAQTEAQINQWLLKNHYGESSMGLFSVEAACSDFTSQNFPRLWERLGAMSEKKKYSKIDLGRCGGAVADYLDSFNNTLQKPLCPFCGKRPSHPDAENDPLLGDEPSACRVCRDHIYFGTHLVKTDRIAVAEPDAELHSGKLLEPVFGRYQVCLDVEGKLAKLAAQNKLIKYWDISVSSQGQFGHEITRKFVNGYVPVYSADDEGDDMLNRLFHGAKSDRSKEELFDNIREKNPKLFLHIAKMALNDAGSNRFKGIEALGVLKADVDNLGLLFAAGLKHLSLSRLATLSRQMNSYFSIYIPYILSTQPAFQNIYTVFAGGDDLFLIGPWNRMIGFVLHLHESFSRYACGNPAVTLSAGISVNRPNDPVAVVADRAEEFLSMAKSNGRNSVTLFDETVKWDGFIKLCEIRDTLQQWLDKGYINNAMFYKFNAYTSLAAYEQRLLEGLKSGADTIETEDWGCLKWRSNFKYNLIRNIGKQQKTDDKQQILSEVEQSARWLSTYGGAFKIALWQLLYNNR